METDLLQGPILVFVGVISGFLNVMAGGGSTLVLPLLIVFGMESGIANGTNRIAILTQNILATSSFARRGSWNFQTSIRLAIWTLPGAIAGALFATTVSDALFQRLLGLIIIGVVISMVIPTRLSGTRSTTSGGRKSIWIYPVMLGIGFYGGFMQVGVGFLFMASLYHILAMDLGEVNIHKVVIVLIYTIPALLVFIATGNVQWDLGLWLGGGSAIGGWLGARTSLRGGERVIRIVLVAALILLSLKLFHLL